MGDASELAELKAEFAALQKQVAAQQKRLDELAPFLSVQRDEKGRTSFHVTCWGLELCHPDAPDRSQILLYANETGPTLSLWGRDKKARVTITAKNDVPEVNLFTDDLKYAVQLRAQEQGGRGQVAVFDHSNPRVSLHSTPQGHGVVSVLHDDGQARAVMLSSNLNGGEFITVTADNRPAVKISGNAPHGGLVSVHHTNGKAGIVLTCTEAVGGVLVNDKYGKLQATLPPT